MFAIIETGGKQYKVEPKGLVKVEKLPVEKNGEVVFDKVLLVADGEKVQVGKPYLEGAKVLGLVSVQDRDPKVRVFKYKSKSRYRRASGHRQSYTGVKITEILA